MAYSDQNQSKQQMASFSKKKRKNKSVCNDQTAGREFFKQAVNHHMHGDISNAEKGYRQALQIGYLNGDLLSNLGVICQQGERTEEAIHFTKRLLILTHII